MTSGILLIIVIIAVLQGATIMALVLIYRRQKHLASQLSRLRAERAGEQLARLASNGNGVQPQPLRRGRSKRHLTVYSRGSGAVLAAGTAVAAVMREAWQFHRPASIATVSTAVAAAAVALLLYVDGPGGRKGANEPPPERTPITSAPPPTPSTTAPSASAPPVPSPTTSRPTDGPPTWTPSLAPSATPASSSAMPVPSPSSPGSAGSSRPPSHGDRGRGTDPVSPPSPDDEEDGDESREEDNDDQNQRPQGGRTCLLDISLPLLALDLELVCR